MECCYGNETVEAEPNIAAPDSKKAFAQDALTVDHLKSTPLYEAIQRGDWSAVDFFLETGTFSFSPFQSYKSLAAPEDQAETWITCHDEDGGLLWRLLPIHAAICYGAPYKTIKELLKIYPASLSCADSEGNLPLHLAVKFSRPNDIFLLILKAFPDAMSAKNGIDNTPLECADELEDARAYDRFSVFQVVVDKAEVIAEKEYEKKQKELKSTIKSIRVAKADLKKARTELKSAHRKSTLRRLVDRVSTQNKIVSAE